MQRWVSILVIFILGGLTALRANSSLFKKQFPSGIKPIEVTKEAASTIQTNSFIASESATVKRVVDGDTIELTDGRKVRYIGIDTPEIVDPKSPVQCFGKEASDENKRLVDGKTIKLEKDVSQTDKFGRLLRYVYIGDVFVNDSLVRQGFAHASTFPPDVRFAEQFRIAQREAQEHNRGLWNSCPTQN